MASLYGVKEESSFLSLTDLRLSVFYTIINFVPSSLLLISFEAYIMNGEKNETL